MLGKLLASPGGKALTEPIAGLKALDQAHRWCSSWNSTRMSVGLDGQEPSNQSGSTAWLLDSIRSSFGLASLRRILRGSERRMELVHVHAAMQRVLDTLDSIGGVLQGGDVHTSFRNHAEHCVRVLEHVVESKFASNADMLQRLVALSSHPALNRRVPSPSILSAWSALACEHSGPQGRKQLAAALCATLQALASEPDNSKAKQSAALLADGVAAHAPFFSPADASRTVYALAKLGAAQPLVLKAVADQLVAKPAALSQLTGKELALLAWAYARASVLDKPLLNAIAQAVNAQASQLSEQDVGMLVWAGAKLQKGSSPILLSLAMARALHVEQLGPHALSMLAWACILVRRRSSWPLAATLVAAAPACMDRMDASQLVTLMYVNAAYKCGSSELFTRGLEMLSTEGSPIAAQIPAMSTSHLARLLWTLGAHDARHTPMVQQLVSQLEIAARAGLLSPLDISVVLAACARLQVASPRAIGELMRCVRGMLVRGKHSGARHRPQQQALQENKVVDALARDGDAAVSAEASQLGSSTVLVWHVPRGATSATATRHSSTAVLPVTTHIQAEETWLPAPAAALLLCALAELKFSNRSYVEQLTTALLSPLPHVTDQNVAAVPDLDPRSLCSIVYAIARTRINDKSKWRLVLVGVQRSLQQDVWQAGHVATMLWSMATSLPHHSGSLQPLLQATAHLLLARAQRVAHEWSPDRVIDVLDAAAHLDCASHPAALHLQTLAFRHAAAGAYAAPQMVQVLESMVASGSWNSAAVDQLVAMVIASLPELRLQHCHAVGQILLKLGQPHSQQLDQLAQHCTHLLDSLVLLGTTRKKLTHRVASGLFSLFQTAPSSPARDQLLPRLAEASARQPQVEHKLEPRKHASDWWSWQWL